MIRRIAFILLLFPNLALFVCTTWPAIAVWLFTGRELFSDGLLATYRDWPLKEKL